MKFNFKQSLAPVIDIAAVTGGAIVASQFLDFQKLMPNADPEAVYIKHQGAVKVLAAGVGIGMFGKKLPGWAKMAIVGVGVAGAIQEARVLTADKINSIGYNNNSASDTTALDRLLDEAARTADMRGVGSYDAGANVIGSYDAGAGVGGTANSDIPNMDYSTTVGWI